MEASGGRSGSRGTCAQEHGLNSFRATILFRSHLVFGLILAPVFPALKLTSVLYGSGEQYGSIATGLRGAVTTL